MTALDIYKYYREEIRSEHNLLSQRVQWLITCQSFLLTCYTISSTKSGTFNWFACVLPAGAWHRHLADSVFNDFKRDEHD